MRESPVVRAALLLPFLALAAACGSSDDAGGSAAASTASQGGTQASAGSGGGGPATSSGGETGSGGAGGAGTGGAASDDPCSKPWPDATNTGIPAGTPELTVLEGTLHTDHDGQIFDAVELRGRLYLDHKNITIKRSRLIGDEYYAVYASDGSSGLTIEDCEMAGGVMFPENTTVRRSHSHSGFGHTLNDGFIFAASHVLIEDSLVDGLMGDPGAHIDGIQDMGGTDVVFRHNWIDPSSPPVENGGVNAAIFVSPEFDNTSSDVTVECNMLLGGESWYTLRLYNTSGKVVVRGNRFDRNFMGVPVYLEGATVTDWADNAYADNGEQIPAP